MTSSEFTELVASYILEPWGDERGDLRAALGTMHILNTLRSKKSDPVQLHDVLLRFEPTDPMDSYTDEEQEMIDDALVRQWVYPQ